MPREDSKHNSLVPIKKKDFFSSSFFSERGNLRTPIWPKMRDSFYFSSSSLSFSIGSDCEKTSGVIRSKKKGGDFERERKKSYFPYKIQLQLYCCNNRMKEKKRKKEKLNPSPLGDNRKGEAVKIKVLLTKKISFF